MKNLEEIKRAEIIAEINAVESALSDSYINLQSVTEEGLLDYYAYKIKSEEAKHKYLLDKIREM